MERERERKRRGRVVVIYLNASYRFYKESFIAYIQGVTLKITDIMAIRHRE
jgi:hypothetical protein